MALQYSTPLNSAQASDIGSSSLRIAPEDSASRAEWESTLATAQSSLLIEELAQDALLRSQSDAALSMDDWLRSGS